MHDRSHYRTTQSILELLAGNGLGQVLRALALPFLARLYTPTEFGHYAVFAAVCGIAGSFICLRYETALALTDDANEQSNLFFLCLSTATVVSILLTFGLLLFPISMPLVMLIVGTVFFQGIRLVGDYLLIQQGQFRVIAVTNTVQHLLITGLQLLLPFLFVSSFHLALAVCLGTVISAAGVGLYAMQRFIRLAHVSLHAMRQTAIKYRQWVLYNLPGNVVDSVSAQVPTMLINVAYGATLAGIYAMIESLLRAPISMVGISIRQVHLNRVRGNPRPAALTLRYYTLLFALGLPMAGVFFVDQDLLGLLLGDRWLGALDILLPMSLLYFCMLPVFLASNIFAVAGRQKTLLQVQIIKLLLRIAPLGIVAWYFPFQTTVGILALMSCLGLLIELVTANRIVGILHRNLLTAALRKILYFLPYLLLLALCLTLLAEIPALIVSALLLAVYYSYTFRKFSDQSSLAREP